MQGFKLSQKLVLEVCGRALSSFVWDVGCVRNNLNNRKLNIIEYPGLTPVQLEVTDKCSQLCLQVSADLLATIDKLFDSIDPWLWRCCKNLQKIVGRTWPG